MVNFFLHRKRNTHKYNTLRQNPRRFMRSKGKKQKNTSQNVMNRSESQQEPADRRAFVAGGASTLHELLIVGR